MTRTTKLRKRRSSLTPAWDRHVASSRARSAWRISPRVTEAPLTDKGDVVEA
jgi:hypothetical protein